MIRKKSIVLFVLMFFFVMISGTIIGNVYALIFDPLFLILSLGCFFKYTCKTIKIDSRLFTYVILEVAYIFNFFVYFDDGININAYFSYMIRITACFLFCQCIDNNDFEIYFSKVIVVIAYFSLVMYLIGQTRGIDGLVTYQGTGNWPMFFIYNFTGYIIKRNSGVFWEPGAYQLFLNIALMFRIKNENYELKKIINLNNLILVISVITTRSTSGYLSLIVVLCFLILKIWTKLSKKEKVFLLIPLLAIIIFIIYSLITSVTVTSKFTIENRSFAIRLNDLMQSINILKETPIYGLGVESLTYFNMTISRNILANSVGILVTAITMGMPFALFYLFCIIRYARISQKEIFIAFIIIIIISMMTEDFFRYGIYFVLLIGFNNKDKNEVYKNKNS